MSCIPSVALPVCMAHEEEDTCMAHEEEDTCDVMHSICGTPGLYGI